MNEIKEIDYKRRKAIILLSERIMHFLSNSNKNDYTAFDFTLDKCMRDLLDKPKKDMGKPPYDWL